MRVKREVGLQHGIPSVLAKTFLLHRKSQTGNAIFLGEDQPGGMDCGIIVLFLWGHSWNARQAARLLVHAMAPPPITTFLNGVFILGG